MAQFIIEDAVGVPDGLLRIFRASAQFRIGSAQVFLNGDAIHPSCFSEISPNEVELVDPPRVGDDVDIGFMPLL